MKSTGWFCATLIAGMFAFSGCSTTPPTGCSSSKVWYKTGANDQETRQDLLFCQNIAIVQATSSRATIQGATFGQSLAFNMLNELGTESEENKIVCDGMKSMGYIQVDRKLLLSGKPIPDSSLSTSKEKAKWIIKLQSKAESGDLASQYFLGNCYFYGTCGAPQDNASAKICYDAASSQNVALASGLFHITPNAYGLGINADQYGRPTIYQLQNGQQLDPIFNNGVKQNAYAPGVGQDQFGRPVYNSPP